MMIHCSTLNTAHSYLPYLLVGVPIMAVAMAETAQVMISQGDVDQAKETIDAVVTKEELEFLQELGLEDFDGKVDKAEVSNERRQGRYT